MNQWKLYWLTRLPTMQVVSFMLASVLVVVTLGCFIGYLHGEVPLEYAIWAAIPAATLLVVGCLCPSGEELALIIAGSWAMDSEQVRQLPDNVLRVLNGYLNKKLQEGNKK